MKKLSENKKQRMVEDILKLVSIKSFTGDRDGILECQTKVSEIATDLGFLCSFRGDILVIEPRNKKSEPELGIVVHLDTVPFDEEVWTVNPLGEIKDGRIFGRGVVDDKAAIVLAMYAMLEMENQIESSWQIIVGSSEEGEWTDIKEYLEGGYKLPKFLITIDGDGVQNGCRGYIDLELTFERVFFSQNLTNLEVVGGANNTVPGKAVAVVNETTIEMIGKPAHSSIPHTGDNALVGLLNYLRYFGEARHINCDFLGLFNLADRLKYNDARCIGFKEHPEIMEGQKVGYTSVCMTNCKYMGDKISVNLNIRLSPYVTKAEINNVILDICFKYQCSAEVRDLKMPVFMPSESKEIQMMLDAYEEVLGKKTEATFAMGCGYNAAFPNCAIFGPRFAVNHDEEDTCHAADENRKIEDLLVFFEMLCKFLAKYYS